ncbi:MAG: hypothetical protein WA419_08425 [Silvibacterium sp.]
MRLRFWNLAVLFAVSVALFLPLTARAVSCTTQSQMTQAERSLYERDARSLGTQIQAANVAAVRADTVAAVAAQFDSVAASIQQVAPQIGKATLTVHALYNLNALDMKAGADQAEFFCSVPSSSLMVTVTIPQLPPGNYVLAVLHATGVEEPQQLSLILQNDPAASAQWKLAGLYIRPLTAAGHDGVWFWTQARALAEKKQNWNSYFYYQTAEFLLNPVDFLSSPNLQKLQKEAQEVRPAELPGKDPLILKAAGENLEITRLRTEGFQGGLDLVVDYKAKDVSGPVATRTQIVELMKAMLVRYPELRTAFHGLWVYAYGSSGQPFAIELPMNQIQ